MTQIENLQATKQDLLMPELHVRRGARFFYIGHLTRDLVLSGLGMTRRPHILIACMPKSGSTFLSAALASYPGFKRKGLAPAYGHREQELSELRLSRNNHLSYVAQQHLRNSAWTQHLIDKYNLTPIVLVRNLADVTISFRDHIKNESTESPMAFFKKEHAALPDAELEECIVNLAMPWYLNFYLGWKQCKKSMVLFYDDLIKNPEASLAAILDKAHVAHNEKDIQNALAAARGKPNRLNVGVSGRGKQLAPKAAEHLDRLLSWYPELKDDRLFVETRSRFLAG